MDRSAARVLNRSHFRSARLPSSYPRARTAGKQNGKLRENSTNLRVIAKEQRSIRATLFTRPQSTVRWRPPRQQSCSIHTGVLRSSGKPLFINASLVSQGPGTDDPILQQYKFTNAYRASDRVSQYFDSSRHIRRRPIPRRNLLPHPAVQDLQPRQYVATPNGSGGRDSLGIVSLQ